MTSRGTACRRLAWALSCLVWAAISAAHASDTAGFDKGLLWKIEHAGLQPSYLFGTIHSEDSRVLAVPPAVQAAFDEARVYVMEARIDESAMASMSARMMFSDGHSLKGVLDSRTYAETVAALANYGLPELALASMKPWAVAMTLSMPKPQTGLFLDLALMQNAAEQGKQIAGLETVDEQLEILDQLPMGDQVTMLKDALQQLPELNGMFAQIHEAYLARDLARMMRLSEEQEMRGDRKLTEKVMGRLVDSRNHRMAQRIEPFLKSGSAFIAIGALHLPGRDGVLNLLKQQGYRLTPVY
jgi:uncharacterized protein YbaP (TraB family)